MLWISVGRLHWKWSAVWASIAPGTLMFSAGSCTAGIPTAAVWDLDQKWAAGKREEICGCPVLCRGSVWLRGNCCLKFWQEVRQPELPSLFRMAMGRWRGDKRHWACCIELVEGKRLLQVEISTSEHLLQAGLFLASSSAVQRKRKGRCVLLGSDCYSNFWLSIALCRIEDIIIHEKASYKASKRDGKKLQVLILIRGACLPGVRCLSVKSRR